MAPKRKVMVIKSSVFHYLLHRFSPGKLVDQFFPAWRTSKMRNLNPGDRDEIRLSA